MLLYGANNSLIYKTNLLIEFDKLIFNVGDLLNLKKEQDLLTLCFFEKKIWDILKWHFLDLTKTEEGKDISFLFFLSHYEKFFDIFKQKIKDLIIFEYMIIPIEDNEDKYFQEEWDLAADTIQKEKILKKIWGGNVFSYLEKEEDLPPVKTVTKFHSFKKNIFYKLQEMEKEDRDMECIQHLGRKCLLIFWNKRESIQIKDYEDFIKIYKGHGIDGIINGAIFDNDVSVSIEKLVDYFITYLIFYDNLY